MSPIVRNINLHYSLELWFTRVFQKGCYVQCRIIRYAEDFVACFEQEGNANRFRQELDIRLSTFALEISPEKTKTIEFGPFAEANAKRRGSKAATFDFLEFTNYCSRTRDARRFRMKRVTSRKNLTVKLHMFRDWLKANLTLPTSDLMDKVASKLRRHYVLLWRDRQLQAHPAFNREVHILLCNWLNRRGKGGCMN